MRKFIIALLILLALALPACAEDAPLFPALGENGKWGYINASAE